MEYKNVIQKPRIEKVVVNIGVGESGEKLGKAETLLEKITDQKPVRTDSKHKIPTWNLRKREPIGCKVTLRGNKAEEFLERAFTAKDNKIPPSSFDDNGNLSFGITEYLDIPGMKFDPEIGIFGMDVCVTVERPGFVIKRRKINQSKIPKKNHVAKDETIQYIKEKFGVEVE